MTSPRDFCATAEQARLPDVESCIAPAASAASVLARTATPDSLAGILRAAEHSMEVLGVSGVFGICGDSRKSENLPGNLAGESTLLLVQA